MRPLSSILTTGSIPGSLSISPNSTTWQLAYPHPHHSNAKSSESPRPKVPPSWLRVASGVITPPSFQAALAMEKALRHRSKVDPKLSSTAMAEISSRPRVVTRGTQVSSLPVMLLKEDNGVRKRWRDHSGKTQWIKGGMERKRERWYEQGQGGYGKGKGRSPEVKWAGAVRTPGKALTFCWGMKSREKIFRQMRQCHLMK